MFTVYKNEILDVKCTSCLVFIWTTGRDKQGTPEENSIRDEIHEKNSRIHLDRLQNK